MPDRLTEEELDRRDAIARRWLTQQLSAYPDVSVQAVGAHLKLTRAGKWIGWMMRDHHGDGRVSIVLRCEPVWRQGLEAEFPETFGGVPYVGKRPRIGAWLDRDATAWDAVAEVLARAILRY
jgi:hypothetical protein